MERISSVKFTNRTEKEGMVTFPADWSFRLKALLPGAVFLIDFVHFENKGNN